MNLMSKGDSGFLGPMALYWLSTLLPLFNIKGAMGRAEIRKKYGIAPGNFALDAIAHGICCGLATAQASLTP